MVSFKRKSQCAEFWNFRVDVCISMRWWDLYWNSVAALFFTVAPKFTESQSKARHNLLAVPAGKSVKLECSASGYARPTVTWYKEGLSFEERKGGKKLSLSKWSTVLSLKDLYPSDTGAYTCTVKNPLGCISQTYKVDVHGKWAGFQYFFSVSCCWVMM